ncbi:DUF927 domain-containing protein [Methylorubrum rhodesianum]|uniref:DUF927 domain-containing protein n=1 Tax=Methylorubrum rhodesianum TaxID=29427 RepID=UPI003CFFF962
MPGKALVPCRKSARCEPLRKTVKLERTRTVSPPAVVKIARVVDEATGTAFDRFEAKSDLGQPVQADVPCEDSEAPQKVLRELRKHNAALTTKASLKAIQEAIDAAPGHHVRHAAQTGWYPGGPDVFVRPTHVVGLLPGVEELLPPRPKKREKRQIVFGNAGTIEGWRDLAEHARWSTRATLMIGAAFAGPLLRILGMQSFGVILYGPSKSGKSTAQVAGGSAIGLRNEEALPTFEATTSGHYQIAGQCNDSLFPMNEVGSLGTRAYEKLGPLMYALSGGKDRARHDVSVYASDAAVSGWALVYAMSSEHSAAALAAQCGMTRGGDAWRCFDVPAVHHGHATIFDRRPRHLTDKAFARLSRERMAEIRKLCEANHGVAFDAYLRGLIELGENLKPRVEAYVEEFVRSLRLRDADGGVHHAARNFGVIYAGLRLAMDMKLLKRPWRPISVKRAVASCFRDGLKVSRLRDTTLEEAKAILHQRLQDTALPRKEDLQPNRDVGFRTTEGADELVAIRSTEFVRWFAGKPAHLHALLAWLDEQGALRKSHERKRLTSRSYEWAVTFPRAPGFKGRCIVLRLPIPK